MQNGGGGSKAKKPPGAGDVQPEETIDKARTMLALTSARHGEAPVSQARRMPHPATP